MQIWLAFISSSFLINFLIQLCSAAPKVHIAYGRNNYFSDLSSLVYFESYTPKNHSTDEVNIESCTGTVLSESLVLTAAHCLYSFITYRNKSKIFAYPNLIEIIDLDDVTEHEVVDFRMTPTAYEQYKDQEKVICGLLPYKHGGDIAVVKISPTINLQLTKIIPRKPKKSMEIPKQVTIAGYGRDENDEAGNLNWGKVMIRDCPIYNTDSHVKAICYNLTENAAYTKSGDSGGPAFDDQFNIVGVLSGQGSGSVNGFTVYYAHLAPNYKFITKAMEELNCSK